MLRTSISRTLKCIAQRSGVFTDDGISQIAPHLMRASCATNMSENGVPIQVIQKMLGHSHLDTTMVYIKTKNEDVEKVMKNYVI